MTTPATEKAAPIPADVLAPFRRMAECTEHTDVRDGEIVMRLQHPETKAWVVLTRADFRAILVERFSQEERIREDERESCARIADDAARNAGARADRSDARTASGASVLTGYIFARTEAEAIAKAIRLRARLRGDAS